VDPRDPDGLLDDPNDEEEWREIYGEPPNAEECLAEALREARETGVSEDRIQEAVADALAHPGEELALIIAAGRLVTSPGGITLSGEMVARSGLGRLAMMTELIAALPELRGKRLGCWCAPHPCHGDLLKGLANTEDA
jgi:hypothetical protein